MEGNRCAATLSGLLTEMWTACREGVDPAVEEPVEGCGRRYPGHVIRGLVLACHPLPTLAVTAFATGYAATVGLRGGRLLLLAAAVLTGQLVIGWVNDRVDAADDAATGRTDKPVATGLVTRRVAAVAAALALVATTGLSLALGPRPGLLNLLVVGCGLTYDLALKRRATSPLPYLLAFGALPAVATTALPAGRWPPVGVMLGAGLLGVAAHFANTVPDVEADRATGVRGLPQRLGPRFSLAVTAALVVLAAVALLAALPPGAGPVPLLALGCGCALAAGVLLWVAPPGRRAGAAAASFRLVLLAVALVVAGFLIGS